MIIYFADRVYTIIGMASTNLPEGFRIIDDTAEDEIGTGFSTFNYTIALGSDNRRDAERMMACGNYIFRYDGNENNFRASVILESETDPISSKIELYSEDIGLELLNGLAPAYISQTAMPIEEYVKLFTSESGYRVGRNELSSDYILRLGWDSDETITARLLDIASRFDAEIYCTFDIEPSNFFIKKRYVNIVRKRGKDVGIELRVGRELSNIRVKRSMTNVATALIPKGAALETGTGIYNYTDLQGIPRYTWVKFADNSGGLNMDDSASGHKYIGLAIDKPKVNESVDPVDYSWRRTSYEDTIVTFNVCSSGYQEVGDGQGNASYTWVSFAPKIDGKNMSNEADKMSYIGIAKGQNTATKSTNPEDYEWFDMREATSDRRVILINPSNNAAVQQQVGYAWVKFGTSNAGAGMADSGSGKTYLGLALNQVNGNRTTTASDYEWNKIEFATTNGGYSEIGPVGSGVKMPNGKYVWFMFTDLEEKFGPTPDYGDYIGFLYDKTKASPISKDSNEYEWHDVSGTGNNELTLEGYRYDDGDFYIDGKILKSREALSTWARDVSAGRTSFGHIYRNFSCEAETQKELLDESIKELKKVRELEMTYEAELIDIPRNLAVGDTVRIVDRDGELYLQARLLKLETSESRDTRNVTFGEYKRLSSGLDLYLDTLAWKIRQGNYKTKSLVQTVTTYFISTDTDDPPSIDDPGWSTEAITQQVGQHVWQMTATTCLDGSVRYSDPAEITGLATAMNVYTLYYKSSDGAPAVPSEATVIPPEGWSLEEPVYDSESAGELYSVTLTTYSNGEFEYSDIYKDSTYSKVQDVTALANDTAEAVAKAEESAKAYTDQELASYANNIISSFNDFAVGLSDIGLTVDNNSSPTVTILDSDGLRITRKSDGVVIAQFDNDNSYVDFLKVNRYLSFGAHRTEKKTGQEYDGTSIEGTAFFWTGGE